MMAVLSLLIGSGCSESVTRSSVDSSHDHHHEAHGPESLKDALAQLTSLRNVIRDSFARDDQDAAHGPLHEVGEILEAIPELSKNERVSEEKLAVIQSTVNTLMDAFGRVDRTMHGQEGSTYAEESATIDTALKKLAAASDPSAPPGENSEMPASADTSAPTALDDKSRTTSSNGESP
jgi:hypothetical protein